MMEIKTLAGQSTGAVDPNNMGEDEKVRPGSDLSIIRVIQSYKDEAFHARKARIARNFENTQAFLGNADWSHKQPGQSSEFLPMVAMAVEHISGFIKKALTNFGDWFSVEVSDGSLLTNFQIRDLILTQLNTMSRVEKGRCNFLTIVSDAVKVGLLDSLMVVKVHGRHFTKKRFTVERGQKLFTLPSGATGSRPVHKLKRKSKTYWHLLVDLVRPEDYYPDPTGRGLYEIHVLDRDLSEIQEMAKEGIYDQKVVDQIAEDFASTEIYTKQELEKNQLPSTEPEFRKRVRLWEFWGTILDENGAVCHENVVCTVANEKYLIRKPEPNPYWHGQSPFVACPLIRVPFSVWHKALMDHATPLNIAQNELFNLMLDGGLAAVWGVRQVHESWLERPEEVSGGIPQGMTVTVKDEVPPGAKVIEQVTTGNVPQDAMLMFQMVEKHFEAATVRDDINKGMLPEKAQTATAVVASTQASSGFFDSLVRDVETEWIEKILYLAWWNILQDLDDLRSSEVASAVGQDTMQQLAQMSPEERFVALGQDIEFHVHGISGTMEKAKDFQKRMALMQMVQQNPVMLQAFYKRFSANKILEQLFKDINLNPAHMELTKEEQANLPQSMAELPMFQAAAGVGKGTPDQAGAGGAPEQAAINQTSNPLTGIGGGEG